MGVHLYARRQHTSEEGVQLDILARKPSNVPTAHRRARNGASPFPSFGWKGLLLAMTEAT
jgi:hypothetical protein